MRLSPFQNDYDDYDFSAISKVISEYYPDPNGARLTDDNVAESPGFKKIGARVDQEFMNQKVYREKWGKLGSRLKKKFKKDISVGPDLTSGSCFMGELVVKETRLEDFAHIKTLKFHISILGPFFTIYGVDSSTVFSRLDYTHGPQTGHFDATNAITISPIFEYETLFKALEQEIRDFYPDYLFVPYQIGMSTLKNISFEDDSWNPAMMDTVYEGIFGRRSVHDCLSRGNERYGFNDWLKPMSDNERHLQDEIKAHIKNSPNEITLHKVWKLQESKSLDTFSKTGNLMFGMDLFDVIDLTYHSELILISDSTRGTIGKMSYTLQDGILSFPPQFFSLRIAELTKDRLTLVVNVNLQEGNVSLNGEIKELKFVAMTS